MVVQRNLTTVAEFEQFADAHPDRRFELIDGAIIEKMPTEEHGVIALRIGAFLLMFVESNGLGRVAVEPRHRAPEDDTNSRIPDVAFTSNDRLLPLTKSGSVPQMPDLAVEVQSPGQSDKLMTDKAQYYLTNGSQMVWLIYPKERIVEVLTDDTRHLLGKEATLTGGDLLPGFEVTIKTLFPEDHD